MLPLKVFTAPVVVKWQFKRIVIYVTNYLCQLLTTVSGYNQKKLLSIALQSIVCQVLLNLFKFWQYEKSIGYNILIEPMH